MWPNPSSGQFYLQPGERVVLYGDSITELDKWPMVLETFVATRMPAHRCRFFNVAWSGETTWHSAGGTVDVRINRDVAPRLPDVIVILLGSNDGRYVPFSADRFAAYATGYRNLLAKMSYACPGVRFTLSTPPAYDDVTREPSFDGGYNGVMLTYGTYVTNLAAAQGHRSVDMNAPMVSALRSVLPVDATWAKLLIGDRIHPGEGMSLAMAGAVLTGWKAPGTVTDVELSASGAVTKSVNATVTGIASTATSLKWYQTDACLPYPVNWGDKGSELTAVYSGFMDSLNTERLQISNLPASRYHLFIGSSYVGDFTPAQLSAGVNLARYSATPMYKQAWQVYQAVQTRAAFYRSRWRGLEYALSPVVSQPTMDRAVMSLDDLETELAQRIWTLAQPKQQYYQLVAF
jgi:lysophospholipase L1-like esterase